MSKLRILVIDDEEDLLLSVKSQIESFKEYDVETAATVEEAQTKMKDVVLKKSRC